MAGFMAASAVYVPGGESNFVYGAEVSDDFEIENGTLTSYKGNGGVVVIPPGVEKIGKSAFLGCSNLTRVEFPEGVLSIEAQAFKDCTNLEDFLWWTLFA